MAVYRPTIGLEVHAELKTNTKMFCSCRNAPDERTPNVHVCPVCMAHPGSLPVINREAVAKVLLVGKALGARLADYSEFDRKSYFYPDIPKGYQISQFAYPLISGGALNTIAITRVHLEEDTARSQHLPAGKAGVGENSLVDYNRAGVPLMELVTEPVIHSAEDAGAFARELQLLLRTLGASDANMEKGEMRVEANISVSQDDTLGTKVEVKNLNSFRSVERAIAFEVARQSALLEQGGQIVQETRGWDETKQNTFSQRKKESSHDYRYFPDPDLPKLKISEIKEFSDARLSELLPELPWARRSRYNALGLKPDDADMFVRDAVLGTFFDAAVVGAEQKEALLIANYIASDIAGARIAGTLAEAWLEPKNAERISQLIQLIAKGDLSSRGAKETLAHMFVDERSPKDIATAEGLLQQSDEGALMKVVDSVVVANPGVVADYKAGKEAALQFLVGQGMKGSGGAANPAALRELFKQKLQ